MSEHRNKKKQLVSALVWRTMLWTLIICLFGSVSTFTVLLRAQEGFGVHDFPAILVWTVFFSIAVVLSATVANPLTSSLPVTIKLVLFALLGVLLAMSAVLVTALLLGPWLRAFSIPLVLGWLVGAVSGLLGGGFYAHTKSAFHTVALSSLVTVLLVTGILLLNSEILAMEPVSVIPVRWEPDSGPTTASDNLQRILTDKESSLLTSLNLGGTFIVEGISKLEV